MTSTTKSRPTILPLAITVGLLVFFLTGEMQGGLTGIQGFFVGFGAVFAFSLIVVLLARDRSEREPSRLDEVMVAETGEEITIRIRLDQLGRVPSGK